MAAAASFLLGWVEKGVSEKEARKRRGGKCATKSARIEIEEPGDGRRSTDMEEGFSVPWIRGCGVGEIG